MQTVRAVRMHKAAGDIVRTSASIASIGRSVGYPSVQSFTRAFTAHFNQSPASYRRAATQPISELFNQVVVTGQENTNSQDDFQISIRVLPRYSLMGIWHQGDYLTVGRSFAKVFASAPVNVIHGAEPVGMGVYFQDPASVKSVAELSSFIGALVPLCFEVPPGLERYEIPTLRCAVLQYRGSYVMMERAYQWLYHSWLPKSGLAVADHPPFELYLNSPRTTAPEDLITQICIPVAPE